MCSNKYDKIGERYIKVEWPEIQEFQTEEISDEDYTENVYYDPEHDVWFVDELFYKRIQNGNV